MATAGYHAEAQDFYRSSCVYYVYILCIYMDQC